FNPANYPDCTVAATSSLAIEAQDAVLKSHTKFLGSSSGGGGGSVVGASVNPAGFATGEIFGMGTFDARTIYGRTGFALTFSNADVNQNDYTGSSARNRGHFPTEPRCIND